MSHKAKDEANLSSKNQVDLKQLQTLYKKMADMTKPECAKVCRVPFSCCSPDYCEMAEQFAKEKYDIKLPRVPLNDRPDRQGDLQFMSKTGCTVPPYLRPLCTLHTCEISRLGFKTGEGGAVWTRVYFSLRNLINKLEFKLNWR